ncbi:hypothetical protein K2173_007138 [Erythroxylum novogranatense]|uniref:ADP-ribosyl cyclase/cyclic ADP-ribose hydrolase n=1 Tax=Erythroxylum novogranatense TaxID=1862640 RepID=A0AAV8SYG8_9ROSI|nr:hypothetical protein K2173_007138 [Erythroxylum novogranatense]
MATQQRKHHVFISFRGEDTRHNFVCHLYDTLSRKGLKTFVDDQLPRGKEINPVLLQAIQDSKVALIIFSENYASSSWCLDELLKIIECHETHNQIVIPVFYRVNPSDVRKQNGSFGKSFAKHSENPRYSNKIQKWKDALIKAANISGRGSDAIREDNKLIDQIVRDVLEKLKHLYPCSLEDFVGLDSKISQVKNLLTIGSSDVRMLGIWGMGGIGKTTLAEAIFTEVSSQFEGRCFVRVSEKGGIEKLLEQLISELLEEREVKIYTKTIGLFLQERLKSKRVFVVFDDVSDPSQLKDLTGNQSWFGAGSNIIITSRDEQVFKGITDNIYEVKALSHTESHQLFVRYAFKEEQTSQDHIPLIGSFVNYARGNPLAIKVLGSCVCGKGVKLWKSALTKLSNCPNEHIQNVLKLSYDGLDREEKAIFLHIACFFKGENKKVSKRVFKSCGLSADIGVSSLVGKSLVIISENDVLDMHDLLQEMGREIVRKESDYPRCRSRLWDAKEICDVFEEKEGTEATEIESISLNTSQIQIEIELDPNVFKRMPNLKFLRFYSSCGEGSKLRLTRGLYFLPSGLRYLYWDKYQLESLPTDFDAKELRVLHLPGSNIKQILKEVKDGGKLKVVAQSLIESPLISRVIDIVFGKLPFGIGNKVPSSSCRFVSKITHMDMEGCQNLKSFPNNVDFQCLEILNLRGCLKLKIFPEISTNLRKLDVGGTSIKEVHSSSIEGLSRLQELNMEFCKKLESLPSNICKLQALQKLDLGYCSSLKKFPKILEPMYNLRTVNLSFSAIEAIPSSIDNIKRLDCLFLVSCLNLTCFPESFGDLTRRLSGFLFNTRWKQQNLQNNTVGSQIDAAKWLKGLKPHNLLDLEDSECLSLHIIPPQSSACSECFNVKVRIVRKSMEDDTASLVSACVDYLIDLPSQTCLRSFSFFPPYYILDISELSIGKLPEHLGSLDYLRELDLRSNCFWEIPASIKQLSLLESLLLDNCGWLQSLPELPTSLCRLSAARCKFLKKLLAIEQPIFNGCQIIFNFNHCLKLEEKACEATAYQMLRNGPKDVYLCYPGSRITEWFKHQTTGDNIRIKLPSNWFINRRFFGFAFCIVFDPRRILMSNKYVEFECSFEDNYNPTSRFTYQTNFNLSGLPYYYLMQQHVLVWCLHDFNVWISESRQLFGLHCINMASFKFYTTDAERGEMKKCGITPLYMQDDEDDDDEDEYDHDEKAYWMLKSLFPTEMSTNEDDDEDMNSGGADDMFSEDDEVDEDMNSGDVDDMFW